MIDEPIRLRTPEELSIEIAKLVARALAAEADNARLREVLKEGRHMLMKTMHPVCPWCRHSMDTTIDEPEHENDCFAFTPDGVVK